MGLFDNAVEKAKMKENTTKLAILTLGKVLETQLNDLKKALPEYDILLEEGYQKINEKYPKVNLDLYIGKQSYHGPDYTLRFFDYTHKCYISFSRCIRGGNIKDFYIQPGSTEAELTSLFEEMLVEIVSHLLGAKEIKKESKHF